MDFKLWLEARAPVRFGTFFPDGRVYVYIRDKQYVYDMDAVHHDRLKKMAYYAPGKAHAEIMQMVRDGGAKLLGKLH